MQPAKILSDLIASAASAKAHFEVWWAQASEAKPHLVATMDNHRDFFHDSYDAHYTALFVYLAHLYDKRADSSSISTYLRAISASSDPTHLEALQAKFAVLAQRAEPLITARHKTIAHIDARLSEQDVFAPLDITWNEARAVIYDSAKFVAELAGTTDLGSIGICNDHRLIEATLRLIRALSRPEA